MRSLNTAGLSLLKRMAFDLAESFLRAPGHLQASLLGVNRTTIQQWRRTGQLTPPLVGAFLYERELRARAKALGLRASTVRNRLARNVMSVEQAYTTPLLKPGYSAATHRNQRPPTKQSYPKNRARRRT